MMRSFDAERVNELVNHPSIRLAIGGDGESYLDLTDAVADESNYFILGKHGGFSLCWTGPHIFEVHTFILPEGRGAWAREAAQMTMRMMSDFGAVMLWTRVHPEAVNVRKFTLDAGFTPAGQHTAMDVAYDIYERRL
jgi:hypothetical protein